jgi:hypothetical protein
MADMIEPSFDHHFLRDRFGHFPGGQCPEIFCWRLRSRTKSYGMTSLSEDQTSKWRKSIASRIVDFDQLRSKSEAGPCACIAGSASFKKLSYDSNQKSLHHCYLVLEGAFRAYPFRNDANLVFPSAT